MAIWRNPFKKQKATEITTEQETAEQVGLAALEGALGLEFRLNGGLIEAYLPGTQPPPPVAEIAQEFLGWLQSLPGFAGKEVPYRLICDHLFPHFANTNNVGHLYSWPMIDAAFQDLPGVKKRKRDGRIGPNRIGPTIRVYHIPLPPDERSLG